MRKYRIYIFCIMLILILAACRHDLQAPQEAPGSDPYAVSGEESPERRWPDEQILTASGLAHEPFGRNSLYGSKEAPVIWWSRSPGSPLEDNTVTVIISASKVQNVWLEWALNGELQSPIPCLHTMDIIESGTSKRRYEGQLGAFAQGDIVEYLIRTDTEELGPFTFTVAKWEIVDSVSSPHKGTITCRSASLEIPLSVSFPRSGTLCLSINNRTGTAGTLSDGSLTIHMQPDPFVFEILDKNGNTISRSDDAGGLRLLTDGIAVYGVELSLVAPETQNVYGCGMRYDSLNQWGKDVDIYCVNWYTDQVRETYTPVPYYFVPDTYGLFADSTAYSRFSFGTRRSDICSITVEDSKVDFYFFAGCNADIADGYTSVAGKPVLPPVWAFGPWISANEWDSQAKVMEQLAQAAKHDIPVTVIVLEAWSDEDTFYIWNDAQYMPQSGDWIPKLADFTFSGRWPDPKSMTDAVHDAGMKLLLWQIPVLRYGGISIQSSRDQVYAKDKGYVICDAYASPYRITQGTWFGGSLLVDFTNPASSIWFLDKRRYLLDEIGVDGFKTDGGEFIWGKHTNACNGLSGVALRNAYPDIYARAYFDYSRKIVPDALTFSRSGGASMQSHPICWVGDQRSTPDAFKDAIRATLSASMSGIPFVAWDIAGFSGDIPSTELYQRSVAQAAFSPIMQIHSETNSGGTPPSQARTPWNMAERKGNNTCLETYRYYANLRMNLLPYIYSEAQHSSITGEPLMRSMAYAFPGDAAAAEYEFQYMLGNSLMVAPVTDARKMTIEVYLPDGVWYDFFSGKEYQGGMHHIECSLEEIPVFARAGCVIPLNLGESRQLGSTVGNALDEYSKLTFRVFPGAGTTAWFDHVGDAEVIITVQDNNLVSVTGILQSYEIDYVQAR